MPNVRSGDFSDLRSFEWITRYSNRKHLAVVCCDSRNIPSQPKVVKPSLQIDRHHIRRLAIDCEHDRHFTGAGQ
jgi:hypothetical protein